MIVADAYRLVLGREAGASERQWWAAWLRPRPDVARRHDHLLAALAGSPELWSASGATAAGFVDLVYERLLGRPADPDGHRYWVSRLAAGAAPATVMRALTRLTEPLGAVVADAVETTLARPPTPQQRATEVARLRADGDRSGLTARLVATTEFDERAQGLAQVRGGLAVALGDSYASGEGNPPYLSDGEHDECHRSSAAYAEVARATSTAMPGTVDLLACSGALIPEVHADQLPDLARAGDPDLVTLTVGGNDIGFRPILTACLQVDVGGSQLNGDYDHAACRAWLDDDGPTKVRELATGVRDDDGDLFDCAGHPCTLAGLLAEVGSAAPAAQVAVVGYPPPVWSADEDCTGDLQWEDGTDALGGRWVLEAQYLPAARALFADLNVALQAAAEDAGATYVDPSAGFAGRDVCSAEPSIYGLRVTRGTLAVDSASFHPTRAGTAAMAAALVAALEEG